MKTLFNILFLCLAAAASASVQGPKGPIQQLPCATATLPAGSLILLETAEAVASSATVGKVFHFRVTTNVMAEGRVAIATGALAVGRVKHVQPATFNGQEEVRIELLYVQAVDGQMVPLYGNEQSFRAPLPGQPADVPFASFMTAQVMNNIDIKVN